MKICECGGIVNYDPYFKAYVCNTCGKVERIRKGKITENDNDVSDMEMDGMTKQELKECIAEVRHSDIPESSKKKIMNVLYEQLHKEKWIPCSVRFPEEKINPITQDFYEYQVTYQNGDVKDIRYYKFGKGHWWNDAEIMDKYVIAWQPLPEPYKGEERKED